MTGIAIIGIGCRFPGGVDDANSYWALLSRARSAITEIPEDRWSLAGFYDPRPDIATRSYSKWGGFLDDIKSFDPDFFGLGPREAQAMDPQQRLLLQVAYEAVQDAGETLAHLREVSTGVFVGVSNTDYDLLQRYRPELGEIQAGTGTALSIIANRISNSLDLSGPSLGIDTACSSSLVALDAACGKLKAGECDVAVAGGVNVLLDPRMFVTFSRAHMLSATGKIRAFDADADGFVRGEGAGVVLLKRPEDAQRDGDRIYAVIRGTAVNQDGRTGTITAPNRLAQTAMMRLAVEQADVDPAQVAFAEAHGTGTPLGDPIEANAIGEVFGGAAREAPLLIGSSKTNIGHLEPAAGIAGVIKSALALHRGVLPPSIGFETPSPEIAFDGLNMRVADTLSPLRERGPLAFGLVNAFGFGGTNACAILQGAMALPSRPKSLGQSPQIGDEAQPTPIPVPLSAASEQQLRAYARRLAKALKGDGPLANRPISTLAAALAGQRDHFEHRAVILAKDRRDLLEKLACLADGKDWPRRDRTDLPQIITGKAKAGRKLAFTATGQGGQWWAMGRDLLTGHEVFKEEVQRFDEHFKAGAGWSVIDELMASETDSRVDDPTMTPAMMFALQAGLAALWKSIGVAPDVVIGHSFGEVTAAYLGGGLPRRDVAHLVRIRGSIRNYFERMGAMAAIGMGAEAIQDFLTPNGGIEICAFNSPSMVTVGGEVAAVDKLIARLEAHDSSIRTKKLALDFSWHSSWLAPAEQAFRDEVGELECEKPSIPVISTVTGLPQTWFDADYWWRNLRQPVRYQSAVERALDLGVDIFVELGPQRTLSNLTLECALEKGREVITVSTLQRGPGDFEAVGHAIGQLYVSGVAIDWAALHGPTDRAIELPRLPWMNSTIWSVPEEAERGLFPLDWHPLLGTRDAGPLVSWSNEISLADLPFLKDHRISGAPVFPVAVFLEMMRAAADQLFGGEQIELTDLRFPQALFLDADAEIQLATIYGQDRGRISIYSRRRGHGADWTLRAEAGVLARPLRIDVEFGPTPASNTDTAAFYRDAETMGYHYGPSFRTLSAISINGGTARGEARADEPEVGEHHYGLDPRLLDGCLQLMIAQLQQRGTEAGSVPSPYVPVGIGRVLIAGPLDDHALAEAEIVDDGAGGIGANYIITEPGGQICLRIDGLRAKPLALDTRVAPDDVGEGAFYAEDLEEVALDQGQDPESGETVDGRWLVIGAEGGATATGLAMAFADLGVAADGVSIPAARAAEGTAYLEAIRDGLAKGSLAGAVYALPVDATEACSDTELETVLEGHVRSLTAFGQAFAALQGLGVSLDAVILTRGARALGSEKAQEMAGLAQSGLLGLARSIAMECPDIHVRLVDLDAASLGQTGTLAKSVIGGHGETELALRNEVVLAPRLRQRAVQDFSPRAVTRTRLPDDQDFALRCDGPAGIGALAWREFESEAPGQGEVQVNVASVGLNFRDVMAASGMLAGEAEPDDPAKALGLEFAGRVRAVGTRVQGFAAGDAVFGLGRGALRRRVTVPEAMLFRVPTTLSMDEAAALPTAYLTAHYALNHVGRLAAGETVLIHNATGGVGLAAVVLAKRADATIFATAGTDEKRAYLRRLGITHVMDSRSLVFADQIARATDGRGVDLVLNALGGAFIQKGLECLAPCGRFLELGKSDVYADAAVGMKFLRRNISLHVVDLAAMIAERPDEIRRLMNEVLALIESGELKPLPVQTFAGADAGKAFRHFADARQIGKIVVRLDDPGMRIQRDLAKGPPIDANATYLVTGGTRGFGLAAARWLADQGAGRVLLASASGKTSPQIGQEIARLRRNGARVDVVKLDVTDAAQVDRAVQDLVGSDTPLRGIVHAAVVYDDALLPQVTEETIARVLAPKVRGTLNLTNAALEVGAELDFFTSFSSLAQVVGWAGQTSYAAANAFLEAAAHYQRARGLPGQCINWSAFGQSGAVARSEEITSYLESAGWHGIADAEALSAFGRTLCLDAPVLTYAAVDWARLAAAHPALARARRIAGLGARDDVGLSGGSLDMLRGEGGKPLELAKRLVSRQVALVLRLDASDLDRYETLDDAGLDSLSTFELRNRLESEIGLTIPLGRFAQTATVADLAELICALASEAHETRAEPSDAASQPASASARDAAE